jgi:hypothetical protein
MLRFLIIPGALLVLLLPLLHAPGTGLYTESKTGPSGNTYIFIYKKDHKADFVLARPGKEDTSVLLCIPAAFTQLTDYSVDGIYISHGKAGNTKKINRSLGGALEIVNGEVSIFPTDKGSRITDSLVDAVVMKKGALFQQIQMIVNGVPASFKDQKLFQRRGIVLLKDGRVLVAESRKAITLKTFADDLAALGASDLLYTDMGAWDEGWYRDSNGKTISMGYDHSQTDRQSNWFIFRK